MVEEIIMPGNALAPVPAKSSLLLWLVYTHLVSKIPYTPGQKLRGSLARRLFHQFGDRARLSTNVSLQHPQKISLGKNVGVARGAVLDGRGGLEIGADTLIGFESVIITRTHNHARADLPIAEQGMVSKPIRIGSGCWIGARAMVLPGVTIGDGCIIGANAVVTRDIPAYSIAVGIPCRVIKKRNGDNPGQL